LDAGLQIEQQDGRARNDDKVPRGKVLLQQPEAGSLAKPAQAIRVVLSLGPRELRVPDLTGLAPRAAALKLSRESLELGPVTWYRDPAAPPGILAQDPEPDAPGKRGEAIRVLMSRGPADVRILMPDFVGKDAQAVKAHLEKFGFRVGSARFEAYDGVAPDTVLKQFPPAGYPLSNKEVVSLTVSRPPDAAAPRS
jgi:serine/threonine-protein kinase